MSSKLESAQHFSILPSVFCLMLLLAAFFDRTARPALAEEQGVVELQFVEDKTSQPIACRLELLGPNGKPFRVKGHLQRGLWTLIEQGALTHQGKSGDYRFRVFHGPQFAPGSGGFSLEKDGQGADVVRLPRHANLQKEGWYGGDLLAFSTPGETIRWMPAEDLDLVAISSRSGGQSATPTKKKNRDPSSPQKKQPDATVQQPWLSSDSYFDDRPGSGLLMHHWSPPAEVPDWVPSTRLLQMAKAEPKTHVELQKLWARDVPLWLSTGKIDSIQILSNHLTWDGKNDVPTNDMFNPDPPRFRGARGAGRLVEYLYWQVLDAGLRIPPSAGSGFGKNSSPLGYNRVYAFVDQTPDPQRWWQAVRDGRSFVTSGPLLRAMVNGYPPGHVFEIAEQGNLDLSIGLTLTVSDPVEYLDVIFNGQTLYQARLDEYARQGGKIPAQVVKESGWMVIRVVTEVEHTYRIASTAPYYFVVGEQPRVSQSAVEMFQNWLQDTANKIAQLDQKTSSAAEPFIRSAIAFWDAQRKKVTAP